MDNNIVQTVYEGLKADTIEITKTVMEYTALEEKIKDGRYSQKALTGEIYPKRDALRNKISTASANAIDKAKGLIKQYRQEVDRMNDLDPAELTDDIKLLQAGIPLLPRDINAILERSKGNRTMSQLALRYAKDHNIDMHGVMYVGGQQEAETANNLENLLYYYGKWIDKPNAAEMLDKFFGR